MKTIDDMKHNELNDTEMKNVVGGVSNDSIDNLYETRGVVEIVKDLKEDLKKRMQQST
jgi:bacteriocin-like protein